MAETEEYKAKLKSLKKYIPFLVNMMADLRMKGNRDAQLNKIQSLHDMITDDKKKLKLETLNRCEEVLTNIYIKVNPQFKNKPVLTPSSPGDAIEIPDSPHRQVDETPRSPSPERGCFLLEPRTIPTEKISDDRTKGSKRSSRTTNIPKIDIYGAAAFDMLLDTKRAKSPPLVAKAPDISKPPISLDDLKNLEDDVQVNQLTTRPIDELEKYKNELEMQLRVENVTSALDSIRASEINTTVRNKLDLSHVKKVKEAKSGSSKNEWYDHFDIDLKDKKSKKMQSKILKVSSSNEVSDISTLNEKDDSISEKNKKDSKDSRKSKGHKERDSSKEKSKRDKERDKNKNKKSDYKDKTKYNKEKSSSSKSDKYKSRDHSKDKRKSSSSYKSDSKKCEEDKKNLILNRSPSLTNDLKSRLLNSGSLKSEESGSSLKLDEGSQSSLDSSVSTKDDKKDETKTPQSISKKEPRMSFEEQLVAPEQKALKKASFEDQLAASEQKSFKRLADKYNPKPRRTSLDNFDKLVSKKIERNMKSSPSNIPDIFETLKTSANTYEKIPEPTPPPASLLEIRVDKDDSPNETEKSKSVQLPEILQKIFEKANKPSMIEPPKNKPEPKRDPRQDPRRRPPLFLSRDPASQQDPLSQIEMVPPPYIRDPCPESGPPSPTPMRTLPSILSPPIGQQGSMLSPNHAFVPPASAGRFQPPNLVYPATAQGIDFVPPSPCLDFGGATPRPEFEIPPSPNIELHPLRPDFLENSMRVPFQNVNFLQKERFLNEKVTQPMFGGSANSTDIISPLFGTQNSPIPPLFGTQPNPIEQYDLCRLSQYELHKQQVNFYQVNNYGGNFGGMPMLQPEIPNLMQEPKPYMSESGTFHQSGGWREESIRPPQRSSWRDDRRPGDPRNYREYREMREREERERREREREARLLKEKEDSRKSERARSISREDNRERARSKSRHRDDQSTEPVIKTIETDKSKKPTEKSRFDKMYSKTNRDRSGSRSKSGSEDEQFVSPLDSLYSGENDKRTGRGYGVQSFRIPKKKREDPRQSRSRERGGDRERKDKDMEDTSKGGQDQSDTSKDKEAKGVRDKENEDKFVKKPVRRIESDEEDNFLDSISDREISSGRDDQEVIENEPEMEKVISKESKTSKTIDKSKKKTGNVIINEEELQPEDDIVLIRDKTVEQTRKLEKSETPVTKSKAKSVKPKVEPIIKIEESEPEDIIEIKDEEQEDRKKTLRKRTPKKTQSPVASPTKKQPARKAKKTPTIPLPVIVKEERDSDLEEVPSELETIDVDDDEEIHQEIEASETSQPTEQAAPLDILQERSEPEGASNEEMDMFVSEYVLEVIGDTSKVFVPINVEVKNEIIYDVEKVITEKVLETSKKVETRKQIVETKPKTSATKKTSSLEDEAQKRMALINKLAKPKEKSLEITMQESEADTAAKELEDLLQSSQGTITAMHVTETPKEVLEPLKTVLEPVVPVMEAPRMVTELPTTVTESPTTVETNEKPLESQKDASEIVPGSENPDLAIPSMENVISAETLTDKSKEVDRNLVAPENVSEIFLKEAELEQPYIKATEIEIQEPTSSQDELKSSKEITAEFEKCNTSKDSEHSGQASQKTVSEALEGSFEVTKESSKIDDKDPAEGESSKKSDETPEPTEPNILAHFFENLLKSKNKQDKKTALFSLIQTFSDSFTDKELNKITKIIKADDDESDEEASRKDETEKTEAIKENIQTIEPQIRQAEEEAPVVGSTTEEEASPVETKRTELLSSTTEDENQGCDTSETNTVEKDKNNQEQSKTTEPEIEGSSIEEPVLVSVGERIKSRKRNIPARKSSLAGKKKKTELDKIHDDIKEMFIRDGVLTATGKRMTRMLKEDPNALSPTKSGENTASDANKNARKKPGPKSKTRDSKSLKDVRIMLSKIPDNNFKVVSQSKRNLRSNTSIPDEEKSVASDSSEESELTPESSDQSSNESEQEEESHDDNKKPKVRQSEGNQPKKVKKRMRNSWAMGIIKKTKKKLTQVKSRDNSPERSTTPVPINNDDNNASLEEDLDKLFVEPDTNYYYDSEYRKKLVCKLCNFSGMFITTHYLKEHPHSEVLCSRFSPEQAESARKDYQCNKKKYDAIVNKRLALKYNYSCRFCGFTSQTQPIFFYEHCTTHTGEYRHQCGICQFYSVTSKTLNQHFINVHPNEEKDAIRETYTKAIIYGYICGDCNYVQLKEKAVIEHCSIYHRNNKPNVFKINMSQVMDSALEDHKTDLLLKPEEPAKIKLTSDESQKEGEIAEHSKKKLINIPEKQKKVKNIPKKTLDNIVTDSDALGKAKDPEPKKRVKKATAKITAVPEQGVTDTDLSEEKEESESPIKRFKKVLQKEIDPPDESITHTDISEKKEESEKPIKKVKKVTQKKIDKTDESVTNTDILEKKVECEKPIKQVKKVTQRRPDTPDETVTDSDVSTNKEDVEPPKIRRKPGPKSKTRPREVPSEIDTETEEPRIKSPPPVRRKPGPKSKTQKKFTPELVTSDSETPAEPETTDSEITTKDHNDSSASEDLSAGESGLKAAKIVRKRRSLEALICKENGEDLDSVIALSSRSSRAAKQKASKHIKFFLESNECSPRKLKALEKERRKSIESKAKENTSEEMHVLTPADKEDEDKPKDTNIFTSGADVIQEDKRIEEERLKKMEELNKSLNTRSTKLDFVEKLSNRLTNEETPVVNIKEEPKDAESERCLTPIMPVLEKQVSVTPVRMEVSPSTTTVRKEASQPSKKPTLEDSTPMTSVNVNLRSNSLFPDIIQKLQGKVCPPPTHSTPSSEPYLSLEIGHLIRATKQGGYMVFSCHAENCYVSTKDKMVFQLHCKFGHRDLPSNKECICDHCGVNITSTQDTTLMENLYDHLMFAHSDFLELSPKSAILRMRRLSGDKLSIKREDEEPVIKKEKEDEEASKEQAIGDADVPMDTTESLEAVASQGTLELSSDNPFTFKIAEVMSLAESPGSSQSKSILQSPKKITQVLTLSPRTGSVSGQPTLAGIPSGIIVTSQAGMGAIPVQPNNLVKLSSNQSHSTVAGQSMVASTPSSALPPPPLTPISSKPQPQPLVIKEAKLTQAELNKPRKAPKAMTKFIETPGDLYKCPHYYCLFTTNFRAFLERHLKAHKSDTEVMIPCVYCDMKTPWEHVPVHLDIRHAHCRFACKYCLYRSLLKEYVCLHQENHHPNMSYAVIQLPHHKAAKKFSVVDVKIDPKTLCEPFRCLCTGTMQKEYLYENEFDQHLKKFHHQSALSCGYKGCTVQKLPSSQLVGHWASFHGICTYQCGYCKMSSKELAKMYHHFSQFHQCVTPDILVRIGDYVLDVNKELGYSSEAFDRLQHITNLPSNFLPKSSKGLIKVIHLSPNAQSTPNSQSAEPMDYVPNLTGVNVIPAARRISLVGQTVVDNVTSTDGVESITPSLGYVLPSMDVNTPPLSYVLAPTSNVITSSETITLHGVSGGKSVTNVVSITKAGPRSAPEKTLITLPRETLPKAATDVELLKLRNLMAPNVTVVSTKHSIISRGGSPIVTKPTAPLPNLVSSEKVLPVLPAGISLTKLPTDSGGDKNDKQQRTLSREGHDEPALLASEAPRDLTDRHRTPSPILLPDNDENSLDEPLFDNIDVNTDSPVSDPLSIEPTIPALPSEEEQDPIGIPSDDPLRVPTPIENAATSTEVATTSESLKGPTLRRSTSVLSNSDDEGFQKTSGLQGYALHVCASCKRSFQGLNDFRSHVSSSLLCHRQGKRPFQCAHCDKLLKTVAKFVQHIKVHGVLRYSCSLCSLKFPTSFMAKMHMKARHQIANITMYPVEVGKYDPEIDHFIMRPVLALQPPPTSKEKLPGSGESGGDSPNKSGGDEFTYMPDKINDVPIRQIFTKYAKCGLCNFQTKVRVNIVRHLQMHLDDKWVPDTAPVNPVPCLEKNEKMFDKMINLASSSMEGRMGGSGKSDKEKDEDKLPEYVPSHCRFICCAQGCTYLCLEESNLRHHIMALHSDESDFSCGHCKNKIEPSDVDNVIKHLKLHGLQLYKCKYCTFVHNSKHKVERHAADHSDVPVKIVTVRQMDFEQDSDRFVEPTKETTVTKSRPWKCCFCRYTTTTEELVKNHIQSKHNLDCQFMCGFCSFKSPNKDIFPDHFKEKHANHNVEIIYVYQYWEDEVPKEDETEVGDTTPLWQRDKPRVRHIRGILFDEAAPPPIIKSPKTKAQKLGPSGNKTSTAKTSSPVGKNLFDASSNVAKSSTNRNISIVVKSPADTSSDTSTSSGHKRLYDILPAGSKPSVRKVLFDASLVSLETSASKNLSDAIDAVARGEEKCNEDLESGLLKALKVQSSMVKKVYGQSKATSSTAESDPLKLNKKKPKQTVVETDPLKIPVQKVTEDSQTTKSLLIHIGDDLPPVLGDFDGDTDVKDILPTIEEINRVKQGSDEPIIIIDDDDDEEVIPVSRKEPRGKKRGGDLLQEALKMAKLDDISGTEKDDDGVPISEYSEEYLKKLFGHFGMPNNRQWKCPLCLQFRSKRISDFIFHIFKDLNIFRYRCKACQDDSITFKYMLGHIKTHFEILTEDDIEILPSNHKLETWIQMVLREQSLIITSNIPNLSKPVALVDENIACMFCTERFPNAAEAAEHMLKHWITKPFLCMYCPKDYYTRWELRHHQATTHPKLKQVLLNISPTVAEAMQRFDDGFRKHRLNETNQDFPVDDKLKKRRLMPTTQDLPVTKKMRLSDDSSVSQESGSTDTINIVSVNDILSKGSFLEETSQKDADLSIPSTSGVDNSANTIDIGDSDDELIVVTKTSEFIPNEDEVYACLMCAYVTDREQTVMQHLSRQHGPKSINRFKKLSRKAAETSHHVMACNVCNEVFTELKLRLHFMEQHSSQRCAFVPYIFTCNTCLTRFTGLQYVKRHCVTKHPNAPTDFSTITGYRKPTKGPKKKLP